MSTSSAILEPEFFQTPGQQPIPKGMVYTIVGFARVVPYTLVQYKMGLEGEEEFVTGEILYYNSDQIGNGGGELPLHNPQTSPSQTPQVPPSVWDRVDKSIGFLGVPSATAIALRQPANWHYF